MRQINRVKERFVTEGLEAALAGRKHNRVYTRKAEGDFEAHLIALNCSEPPEFFSLDPSLIGRYGCQTGAYRCYLSRDDSADLKKRNKTLESIRMDTTAGSQQ